MTNPLYTTYEKADNALVGFANKGVRAWNWTTGKTKADLVCLMQGVAPILESTGIALINPLNALIVATLGIYMSRIDQKKFKEQEKLEQKAAEKQAIPLELISHEMDNKCWGGVWSITSGAAYGLGIYSEQTLEAGIMAAGHLTRAASFYVIRADTPSRHKKSQLVKKMKEGWTKLKNTSLVPSPQPALEPALCRDINYLEHNR